MEEQWGLAVQLLCITVVKGQSQEELVQVDFDESHIIATSSAAASVLVAADPEWLPGARMADTVMAPYLTHNPLHRFTY